MNVSQHCLPSFSQSRICPAGKEEEVREGERKISLPGGQTPQSVCKEERLSTPRGAVRRSSISSAVKCRSDKTPLFQLDFPYVKLIFSSFFLTKGRRTPWKRARELLWIVSGVRVPDSPGAGQEEVRRGGAGECFPCSAPLPPCCHTHVTRAPDNVSTLVLLCLYFRGFISHDPSFGFSCWLPRLQTL